MDSHVFIWFTAISLDLLPMIHQRSVPPFHCSSILSESKALTASKELNRENLIGLTAFLSAKSESVFSLQTEEVEQPKERFGQVVARIGVPSDLYSELGDG